MGYRALALSTLLSLKATGAASNEQGAAAIAKSIFQNEGIFQERQEQHRRMQTSPRDGSPSFLKHGDGRSNRIRGGRHLEVDMEECDSAFLGCLPNPKCVDCFATLELEEIDWVGVSPDTECEDVVKILMDEGHCEKLKGDDKAIQTFCKTFTSCVVWDDDEDDDELVPAEDVEGWVNCTALTECDWEGIKKNWIGDGICHDNMHGCYNTALCGFDRGDCCEDTCDSGDTGDGDFAECGHDGYACRDPNSNSCDTDLTAKCKNSQKKDDKKKVDVSCGSNEQKYRLIMYDSFGDGWDTTTLALKPQGSKKNIIFDGALKDGWQGTEYICLSKDPTCYNVVTQGGTWGVEVSWEVKPIGEGSPSIAGGGAPGDCVFPAAGAECEKTCAGKPEIDPTTDPEYKSFKELYNCIADKCVIQLGSCQNDDVCEKCFAEDAPEYCFGVDSFVSVIDCTMCSCTEKKDSEFCAKKDGPGAVIPPENPTKDDDNSGPKKCTGQETMKGAKAVMAYGKCANLDETGIMITDFDQSNFGKLDQFEACAHSFVDEAHHGGHTALGCMQILSNAINNPGADKESDKSPPLEAISALAKDLYQNGESFCQCTKEASDDCPLCPSFMSFKSLLYESLDACKALDEIDCAAWDEFWLPCETNLEIAFEGKSDFKDRKQCDYAKDGCGGVGAFPAFRRLDCDKEIDSDAWNFYKSFAKNCLKGDDGIPPGDTPVKSPTKAPAPAPAENKPSAVGAPTAKPYIPSDDSKSKPYVPSDAKKTKTKKKGHFFRNFFILCVLGGISYYIYKQRSDSFNFVQYRRIRNSIGNTFGGFGGGGGGGASNYGYDMHGESSMYSNLNSSTTFEPPSLPPTPQMMGTEMT